MKEPEADPAMAELREVRSKMAARFDNGPGPFIEYVARKRKAAEGHLGGQAPNHSDALTPEEQTGDHSDFLTVGVR